MKIYFREIIAKELADLAGMQTGGQIILIYGKRKVGKTTLVKDFLKKHGGIYLTVTPKASSMLLADITSNLIDQKFCDAFIPSFKNWKEFLNFLFFQSRKQKVTIILDEIQNMDYVDPSFFSLVKEFLDKEKESSQINLIFVTYDYEFLIRTFFNEEKPLYRAHSKFLRLKPFLFNEVAKIYSDQKSTLSIEEILKIYLMFGGLPKYYFLIDAFNLWHADVMKVINELVLKDYAPLSFELKEVLAADFNRGNSTYLSILQAISTGYNTVGEIAAQIELPVTSVNKYLMELEKKKNLIKKKNPLGTTESSKSKFGRYFMQNYFEEFWFRFIESERILFESGENMKLQQKILEKLPGFFQSKIPNLVRELFHAPELKSLLGDKLPEPITQIGSIWDRKDIIEVVVESTEEKKILFVKFLIDIKREEDFSPIGIGKIFRKFSNEFPGHTKHFAVLSGPSIRKIDIESELDRYDISVIKLQELVKVTIGELNLNFANHFGTMSALLTASGKYV